MPFPGSNGLAAEYYIRPPSNPKGAALILLNLQYDAGALPRPPCGISQQEATGISPRCRWGGEMDYPRIYNAAADMVDRNVTLGRGTKTAFLDPGETLTYGELSVRTNRMANLVSTYGIPRE